MSAPDKGYPTFDHDLHARSVAPDDFWGQIRRTVDGRPVPEDQIAAIVEAIASGLELRADDALLDLACGNGALSARLFGSVASFVGVDSSEYLVSVARKHFESPPGRLFVLEDAARFAASEPRPERFTKVLCYGSFSYFPAGAAEACLGNLAARFGRVERVFIGNLPDRERHAAFYTASPPGEGELDDPRSRIGIWRTRGEFRELAAACGWSARFRQMPASFYAAHYRYDAVLERAA